jgi:hypothetical protein
MKGLRKENVSATQEPKWIDTHQWTNNTFPTEQPSTLRPEHYGGADSTYEVFNVLEAWGLDKDFYLGNVIKYVARAGKKDSLKTKEDLQKALVYLQRRIDSL